MEKTIYLKGGSTGTVSSSTIDLSGYSNDDGSENNMLKITWANRYCDGTISGIIVKHSDDNSTWSNLWSVGDLTGDTYKYFYSFYPYIYVTSSYTAGSSSDPGVRVQFDAKIYGLPNWSAVNVCRPEDLNAVFPTRTDTSNNFQLTYPKALRNAKRQMEGMLRDRGLDPNRLFTDGKKTDPTIPGLRLAGALMTWWWINLDAGITHTEGYTAEQEMLEYRYNTAFDLACRSGLDMYDKNSDAAPNEGERSVQTRSLYR